jgi:hypothetical protein
MTFAIYKGERNISELVSRLFRLQGKGSQAASKQAAEALLKANPQLKNFSKLEVGSVITVPDTAPPLHPAERVTELAFMRSAAIGRVQQTVGVSDQQLSDIDSRGVDAIKSLIAVSKSRDLQAAVAKNPDLKKAFAQIVSTSQEMLKELQSEVSSRNQQAADVNRLLTSLMES